MAQAPGIEKLERRDVCYTKAEVAKISAAIVDLKGCNAAYDAQKKLIDERLANPYYSGPSWWQDPTFVWGGMIVSFSAGSVLTWYLLKNK